jgi:hypothetical protein
MSKQINIDPLSVIPVSLQCTIGPIPFVGTGFIVVHQNSNYLITNWHMVTGRDPNTNQPLSSTGAADPTSLEIWFHSNTGLGNWILKTELLIDSNTGDKQWLEHPTGSAVDVIALKLTNYPDVILYPLDRNLANTDLIISPSESISIIGFPLGLAAAGKFPIWKTGHVASDIDLDYNNKQIFLIDATTKSGMSGSPVIARRTGFAKTSKGQQIGGNATRFLGIYSGRIQDQSDVGMVWKPETLDAILP